MAATRIWAPLLLAILINFELQSYCNIYLDEDFNSLKSILRGNRSVDCDVFESSLSSRKCYSARACRHGRIRWPIKKWVKLGYVLMAATDYSLLSIDIKVFMDVERGTLVLFRLRRAMIYESKPGRTQARSHAMAETIYSV